MPCDFGENLGMWDGFGPALYVLWSQVLHPPPETTPVMRYLIGCLRGWGRGRFASEASSRWCYRLGQGRLMELLLGGIGGEVDIRLSIVK